MATIDFLNNKAIEIRKSLLQLIYNAKTGHTGGSLSSVEIIVSLYYKIMKIDPKNSKWSERDRFILSKGHSVEGYYCVLADKGFISKEELSTFSQYQSKLIGHPNVKVNGVEVNTGALGHGLPVGVGMALAGKLDDKDYNVYVLMGDGELAEGSIWEAAMSAAHYKLDNITAFIDRNGLQISGSTEDVMALENLKEKWTAFGWDVVEINGNDVRSIINAVEEAKKVQGKPHMIICNTVKGKGVSFMENNAKWHHGVPTEEQLRIAMEDLERMG